MVVDPKGSAEHTFGTNGLQQFAIFGMAKQNNGLRF
jgi:hypothetical protein